MIARISMLWKSRASPGMLPFSLCNKKRLAIRHMNRPLFQTILSIASYDIEKKVGLRTNQQPLVYRSGSLKSVMSLFQSTLMDAHRPLFKLLPNLNFLAFPFYILLNLHMF